MLISDNLYALTTKIQSCGDLLDVPTRSDMMQKYQNKSLSISTSKSPLTLFILIDYPIQSVLYTHANKKKATLIYQLC